MSVATYLKRYAYPQSWITANPNPETGIIVVIPAYKETTLIPSLESLVNCQRSKLPTEIIIVINQPEKSDKETISTNRACYKEAKTWIDSHNSEEINFHLIFVEDLPQKDHGVGLARKIGMDEALRLFYKNSNVDNGIIACFDADSVCEPNYLRAVEEHFEMNRSCPAASIYFEHDLSKIRDPKILSGIIQYELHLRNFIHAQRFAGFPHSFHAVGSSMAVNANAYQKQGGMNKRKAGEDFYFLHKMVTLGEVMDLKSTIVYPSARSSNRVPFGTGRAMKDWMHSTDDTLLTYNPQSFNAAKGLFKELENIYYDKNYTESFEDCLNNFLDRESFKKHLNDIKSKTSDFQSFRKRFYTWFNALKMMKYIHFCRDNYYENIPVHEASSWLLKNHHKQKITSKDPLSLLKRYRNIDKGS